MTGLSPQLRFDGFVVGGANRLAATAARAVAESPGAGYNPLFIYAKPGLGKTHLLMAIGHAARAIDPALVVEYMTLDDFVEAYHTAVGAGQGETYRRRFVEAGLVLLDDVQFLTQRRETQAELIRLIDQMQSAGRQIVLTSDRPPSEIEALDERLLRRVGGGLVIDIAAPDYETRVAILRRKAEERGVVFAPGVLEAIGALAIDNVRELLGALNRLVAFQAVSDAPLDAAQARLLLGVRGPAPDAPPMGLPAATPAPESGPAADEFGAFLSEVADTLTRQVEQWRRRTEEAILRWEGEGFRVDRLRALLAHELDTDPGAAIAGYERDVERLRELEREARGLSEDLAGSAVFRNPDDLAAAEAALAGAREGTAPPPAPEALWSLDDLVESEGNRLALRSARHVVESPTAETNPLVVIGGAGVGKTHLLHGLGNALLTRPGRWWPARARRTSSRSSSRRLSGTGSGSSAIGTAGSRRSSWTTCS
jgi:chromosomal replication initiation ATPase DnaA